MTDRSLEQKICDLKTDLEKLRAEVRGMQSCFDKQDAWHKEQLAAAHVERNELRDVIREMRSKPPEERVATTDNAGLTDEEKALARAGKTIDAIKLVRSRIHCDLKTAKGIVEGIGRD